MSLDLGSTENRQIQSMQRIESIYQKLKQVVGWIFGRRNSSHRRILPRNDELPGILPEDLGR